MRRVEAIKDLEGAGEANLAERLKEMDGWVGPKGRRREAKVERQVKTDQKPEKQGKHHL